MYFIAIYFIYENDHNSNILNIISILVVIITITQAQYYRTKNFKSLKTSRVESDTNLEKRFIKPLGSAENQNATQYYKPNIALRKNSMPATQNLDCGSRKKRKKFHASLEILVFFAGEFKRVQRKFKIVCLNYLWQTYFKNLCK